MFTEFHLDRVALLAGESVTARWNTIDTTHVVLSLPDGMIYEFDGAGEFRFVVTTSGVVTATAHGRGLPASVYREVAVFEPAEVVPVPMPDLIGAPMPSFGRTGIRFVQPTGLTPALVARGRSVLDLAPLAPAAVPPRPAWATPPTGLTSVVPARAPGRPRWSSHTRWLGRVPWWTSLRRWGTRLFRGAPQ
ncbi:hypothetical protein [Lentzea sp. NBRC 102530]|uniref:hypothetical protein n=1 Tax=Lentzea sp. NBRC 102530 TaxID=3032201 RepID=UPI002555FAD4|nr:hypothetical protein [Lentzea sp. NBRC 102530]